MVLAGLTQGAPAAGDTRHIAFYNVNTKEHLEITYKHDGRNIADAMEQINHMMRDWRRDEATQMAPELVDLIWELHAELGSKKPIHLISGYRSLKTNNALRRKGGGQARKSQHIQGKAADIHFPDVSVKELRNSALIREVGGVGYYPTSGIPFVHVDTDRVRHWPRLPRQELALLFPEGKSKHVPKDGRPITRKDYRIALAKVRTNDPSYKSKATPGPILASFSPSSLSLPFGGNGSGSRSADITASIPTPTRQPARARIAARSTIDRGAALRMTQPSLETTSASGELTMDDPDHHDLLEYRHTSLLASLDRGDLAHPDQDRSGLWLMELTVRLSYDFALDPVAAQASGTARFRGPAVRNLFAARASGQLAQTEPSLPFRMALN